MWLYVDLNSYFASVEQQLHPELRNRPIAVVPMMADTTFVIAASYEAKAFGVKTGTMVKDAKRMCPGLKLVAGHHEDYIRYHEKIITAIESCHPITAVSSIDEVACRLGGRDLILENAIQLAKEIKQKIYAVGECLGCSIGIAPNRFLAKTASDMQKPNGLTVLLKEDIPHKLYRLKLNDLCGIGPRMEVRLKEAGIQTIEQLYQQSLEKLRQVWGGIGGEYFYKWIRGENLEMSYRTLQSISHQHVLPPAQRTPSGSLAVGHKLLHKAAARLRKHQLWARRMGLYIRHVDRSRFKCEIKFLECHDTLTLQENFQSMWAKSSTLIPALKISVVLFDLVHESDRNFSFFDNPQRSKLSLAMDKLNLKYGRNTIYFGSIHKALSSAPTRIAFSSIPDLEI